MLKKSYLIIFIILLNFMKRLNTSLKFSSVFNFHRQLPNRSFSTLIIPDMNESKLHINNYKTLLDASSKLSSPVKVLLYGKNISKETIKEASSDVSEVFVVENDKLENSTSEYLSHIVTILQQKENFTNIIASSNNFGKNLIPRIGGILNNEPLSEISKVIDSSTNTFQRFIYAGNALCTVKNIQKLNLLTIRLTSFNKKELTYKEAKITQIKEFDLSTVKSTTFVENIVAKSDKPELGSASVVISGGRALKSSENFKLLDDLAECFKGSAIGASRAAVDAGYCGNDLQIGQTGKTVAPDLYIAIGISGAIQHIAGMKDSKCIVAINTDPEAPIFNIATYGLVGDLFKVIPELTQKLKH